MNLVQENWVSQLRADNNAVILDVRTLEEFNRGIIEGAVNIDIYKGQGFIYEVEELDKSKNYYVYCHAGARSSQACIIMQQLGFKNTYNLVGGMMEWQGDIVNPER